MLAVQWFAGFEGRGFAVMRCDAKVLAGLGMQGSSRSYLQRKKKKVMVVVLFASKHASTTLGIGEIAKKSWRVGSCMLPLYILELPLQHSLSLTL